MRHIIFGYLIGTVFVLVFMAGLALVPEDRVPVDPNDAVWGIK
jgi:hypothetical protein